MEVKRLFLCTSDEQHEEILEKARNHYRNLPVIFVDDIELATDILVLPRASGYQFLIEEARKRGAGIHYVDEDLESGDAKDRLLRAASIGNKG